MRTIVRNRILQKFNNKCVRCSSREKLEIDHIIPLSRGGREDENNMQVLCKTCNLKKGRSIDINQYFKKGDGINYFYLRTDFPLNGIHPKELIQIFDLKFKELCK